MTKYEQIAEDLQDKILSGFYAENEQLPLEKEMCETYNVSRITIKKAVDTLVVKGLVIKRRGAGTFIKTIDNEHMKDFSYGRQFEGFTKTAHDKVVTSKVLEFRVLNPTEEIAEKLKITVEDFVYYVCRVRYADNEPYVIEYTHMPIDLIKGLKKEILESSIYSYIENDLKMNINSAHRIIRSQMPTELEKEYLEMDETMTILAIDQIGYLDNGQPFEYSESHHRSDRHEYRSISVR